MTPKHKVDMQEMLLSESCVSHLVHIDCGTLDLAQILWLHSCLLQSLCSRLKKCTLYSMRRDHRGGEGGRVHQGSVHRLQDCKTWEMHDRQSPSVPKMAEGSWMIGRTALNVRQLQAITVDLKACMTPGDTPLKVAPASLPAQPTNPSFRETIVQFC